ncbi:MAG: signal peptide peptidase SppA, partial [Bacteroidales bacterium]|nr:signal peptide peptidase SppA [Bacteroidales bacterium]
MKSFFKYLLASVLGVLFAGILLFFIMLGSIGVIVSSKEQPVKLKPNTVLVIDLKEKIIERDKNNPLNKISGFNQASEIGLTDILNNIKKAKTDPNVKGIYLNLTTIKAGIASIEEIRNALIDFKKSEKFIISYSDAYSQTNYYLSSVADKVYMNPEG